MGPYGLGIAVSAVIAVIAALVLRRMFAVITVDGDSMWPELVPGDRVLVRRGGAGRLRRGQVVVVEQPDEASSRAQGSRASLASGSWIVKRIAAAPGDPVPDACAFAVAGLPGGPVPDGKLVLLGDNPESSHDSRQFGYIPAGRVLGVVLHRMAHQPGGGHDRGVSRGDAAVHGRDRDDG